MLPLIVLILPMLFAIVVACARASEPDGHSVEVPAKSTNRAKMMTTAALLFCMAINSLMYRVRSLVSSCFTKFYPMQKTITKREIASISMFEL